MNEVNPPGGNKKKKDGRGSHAMGTTWDLDRLIDVVNDTLTGKV